MQDQPSALAKQPMDYAREYVSLTREKRDLEAQLAGVKKNLEELEPRILEMIESEQLPESFRLDGASVYTRSQIWASPAGGDHENLTRVLSELGMVEYLPSKVNSHSISAYVREHINPETGQIEGLPPELEAALKITETTKAVVNG